jgi:ribosome biogenesis GTPase / thiamine phosphate phosphatase
MLSDWGWDDTWAAALAAARPEHGERPGRVSGQERDRWTVQLDDGPAVARITGGFDGPFPVTGDWVTIRPGPSPTDPVSIAAVLARRSEVSRGAAGDGATEQVLAANVDVIWIVHGLDTPPNLRRIERYLAAAWESGAVPEIVLTKADLSPDVATAAAEVDSIAMGVSVHVVSATVAADLHRLRGHLRPGRTVALLGPSGAGKSTLINALADARLSATGEVRAFDGKGRHTTTRRELFHLPGGALLLDTPGLREFRVWALDEGLAQAFPDIEVLAAQCRFRDCRHESEPGCAVLAAAAAGTIDADRLTSYRKLRAEMAYLERKVDPQARAAAVAKHKTALKTLKYHLKYRRDDGA